MDKALRDKLVSYVNALRPIIYINHFDYHLADELINSVGNGIKRYTYTNAGIYAENVPLEVPDSSFAAFLEDKRVMIDYADDENPLHIFLILKDVHLYLDEKRSQ